MKDLEKLVERATRDRVWLRKKYGKKITRLFNKMIRKCKHAESFDSFIAEIIPQVITGDKQGVHLAAIIVGITLYSNLGDLQPALVYLLRFFVTQLNDCRKREVAAVEKQVNNFNQKLGKNNFGWMGVDPRTKN